ncbi:PLP-dependent aminotransferase family protein [Actinokineospora sp.]|uniref:aminotransferase-like domain-containing protein n=1 Tax=Actinokineospora sp. TaxID=1872133 RepID=UPI003D6AB6E8
MNQVSATEVVGMLGRWSGPQGPLHGLLAARLGRLIDEGRLGAGARLPTDRALAMALSVSRGTVVTAYETLRGTGRITRVQGSGTVVTGPGQATAAGGETANPMFLHLIDDADDVVSMTSAGPDHVSGEITDILHRVVDSLPRRSEGGDLGYHPAGHPSLRAALARWYRERGVPTDDDQILVTTGGQQALSLITHLFVRSGDGVVVEAPTYPGALTLFQNAGARLSLLPVGGGEWDANRFAELVAERRSALAYLVPTNHNPTGGVIPSLVRRRVVEATAEAGVPVVEDDVLAGLGFAGEPPPPLAAAAHNGHVITVGSLSKIVWGGLRVGWLRASAATVGKLARLKAMHDLGSDVVSQLVAVELVPEIDRLSRERADVLRQRHDSLCAFLAERLPDWRFQRAQGGQTLWVELPGVDSGCFVQHALRFGVGLLPGTVFDSRDAGRAHLRVPFLAPHDRMDLATARLVEAWRSFAR